jgi:hypothetical protein
MGIVLGVEKCSLDVGVKPAEGYGRGSSPVKGFLDASNFAGGELEAVFTDGGRRDCFAIICRFEGLRLFEQCGYGCLSSRAPCK